MTKVLCMAVSAAFLLTGCFPIEGVLTVRSPVRVIEKDGNVVHVAAGTHRAKIDPMKDKVKLVIHQTSGDTHRDEKIKAVIEIPDGERLPSNGSFRFDAREIGQSWDIQGTVRTDTWRSQSVREWQRCTITTTHRHCHVERGNRVCEDIRVEHHGLREVVFHSETTTVQLDAQLLEAGGPTVDATLDADRSDTQRINDYVGPCLIGRF